MKTFARLSAASGALLWAALALAQTWAQLATEGGSFTVPAGTTVRYGAGTNWIVKTMTGTGQCTNEFFGRDPAFMVAKTCQVDSTPIEIKPPVVTVLQPPPPPQPPKCWPAQVLGCGTMAKSVTIKPDAASPAGAEPVSALWWYWSEDLSPSGWRYMTLLCPESKLHECLAQIPKTSAEALAAGWNANPPKPAGDGGIGWAHTRLLAQHVMPGTPPKPVAAAEVWVVAKAASTAKPAGTRPLKLYGGTPSMLIDNYDTERAAEGTPCNCAKAKLVSGASTWCDWGTSGQHAAVCVKQ
jgi:hypothetical protein